MAYTWDDDLHLKDADHVKNRFAWSSVLDLPCFWLSRGKLSSIHVFFLLERLQPDLDLKSGLDIIITIATMFASMPQRGR